MRELSMNGSQAGAFVAFIAVAIIGAVQADSTIDTNQRGSHTRGSHARALTGHEWAGQFRCKQQSPNETSPTSFRFPLSNLWFHLMSDCHREELAWRFKYVDELKPAFNQHVRDESIDERLANIIYTISLNNMFDTNFYQFNSGDSAEDATNELRVAGPSVDDAKCTQELLLMSNLYEDLQQQLALMRNTDNISRANLGMEESHIRLARVLDSFGRYESGSLNGKLLLAGSYEECTGSQLVARRAFDGAQGGSPQKVQMRYCVAGLNFKEHLHPLLKTRQRFAHEADNLVLNVAACLPKSCHSKSFRRAETKAIVERMVNSQMKLPDSIYVDDSFELESVFCLVDGDSDFARIPTSGKLCLLVVVLWSVLCVGVTVINQSRKSYDESDRDELNQLKMQQKPRQQPQQQDTARRDKSHFRLPFPARVCNHLDLTRSWQEFTSDKRQSEPGSLVDLDVLNPVKLAACAFCVVAHTALVLGSLAIEPIQIAAYVDTSVLLLAAIMTSVVIDTFFVISGLLMSYISLKKLARRARKRSLVLYYEQQSASLTIDDGKQVKQQVDLTRGTGTTNETTLDELKSFLGQWLVVSLNRYLRIVPFYALLFWFRRDVLNHLGEGPLWDHGLNRDTSSGACTLEPWYTPFTFITAFKQLSKQCFVPSWSISNDIFFGLFAPPLILLFLRRPRLAAGATTLVTAVSVVAAMDAVTTSNMPDVWQYLDGNMHGIALMFRSLTPLYSWPFYRAAAFLVGILAGYYLFDYERRHTSNDDEHEDDENNNNDDDNNHSTIHTDSQHRWTRWLTGPATVFAWVYILWHLLLSIYANDLKAPLWPYHRLFAFYFLNVDRLVWSITNAVLFLQMVTIWRNNWLMRAFSSQKWRTFAKLSFPVIFVHWLFIVIYMGNLQAAPVFTLWHIFSAFAVILVASLGVSTALHVIFENPIDKLIKRELFGF